MRILLIADDTDFRQTMEEMLSPDMGKRFDLTCLRQPLQAIETMSERPYSLCLFHLDDESAKGLRRFLAAQPPLPVVALIRGRDEGLEQAALEAGATACLNSENLPHELLHLLTLSFNDRDAMRNELQLARMHGRQEREMRIFYERIGHYVTPAPKGKSEPAEPLRQSRDTFEHYVNRFGDLLELALESQAYKVDYNLSETVRTMADEFCFLRAGPRDVVDVFSAALKSKRAKSSQKRYQAFTEEGRLLLLELMGYMVTFYKKYSQEHVSSPPND